MRAARRWSVRHAGTLSGLYALCARLAPLALRSARWLGMARAERLLIPIERAAKGFLFDCRMCGQCVLAATGMACPTNCAKQMRNGPCGGVRADETCEVTAGMRCVWVEAAAGRSRVARGRPLRPVDLPPIDRRREGRSAWMRVIEGDPQTAAQPDSTPSAGRAAFDFEEACRDRLKPGGAPVVTVELTPPDSADPAALIARADRFRGLVDAINITDGAGGNCHMSSAAAAALLCRAGLPAVYQVACRDRNRIAIQGDLLGAAALGVRNVLCLTGDDVSRGDQPEARPVFDLDSVSLLRIAAAMRDERRFASGREIAVPPNLFLGATVNPFAPPYDERVATLERKIAAGAQFIQTQFCFHPDRFERFMDDVRARGLHRRAAIIVGVGTLASAKALAWMARNVPGVHVPASVLERIAAAQDQQAEGLAFLVETMTTLARIEGVAGVHVMGHRNEAILAEAIERSGLRANAARRAAPDETNSIEAMNEEAGGCSALRSGNSS